MDNVGKMAARTLAGLVRSASAPQPTYATGTVQRVDKDGTVWVTVDGAESPTPALSVVSAKEGDAVELRVSEGDATVTANHTSPVTDDSAAREAKEIAAGAEGVASEAAAVANATNQHFWADSNGVHVATVEGEATDGPNLLANANGILLRDDSANMAAFTPSAVSFYDGEGNQASNVVASFGANGATMGKADGTHVSIDGDSIDFVSYDDFWQQYKTASIGYDASGDGYMWLNSERFKIVGLTNSLVSSNDTNGGYPKYEAYVFGFTGLTQSEYPESWIRIASCKVPSEGATKSTPGYESTELEFTPNSVAFTTNPSGMPVTIDGNEIVTEKNVRTGVGLGLYGSTKDSNNLYHRFMLTEVPNLRHDTSPDGTNWTTEGYWVKEHRSGDTYTVNINTGGFVTSSTAQIRIAVPLDKPCPSGMTASVTAKGSWTIRSIGGYSHGSSANGGVTPSSVTATVRPGWIDVAANMSSTTGGTNNTPVGVAVSGLVLEFE